MSDPGYVFAGIAEDDERVRLGHLEAWADPLTARLLDAAGVAEGWRCLDVGAGGGSVTRRLSELVGPAGSVVASDLDPRFLVDVPGNVEVRTHDVTGDDLESESYDLVHTRLLLMHLAEPGAALERMLDALKPGGWLVVTEADWGVVTFAGPPDAAWATAFLHDVFARHAAAGIRSPYFGRELPGLVAALGLESFAGELGGSVAVPGSTDLTLLRRTIEGLRSANLTVGAAAADIDRLQAVVDDGATTAVNPVLVGVRGRRPA